MKRKGPGSKKLFQEQTVYVAPDLPSQEKEELLEALRSHGALLTEQEAQATHQVLSLGLGSEEVSEAG